ncbi:hypothetical protein HMPREF2534_03856 [Bacteroides thetaiotaomicron]|nr:hypothetical protein HMPREF2534_03856 [Bacteroides thetaiotaomicron]
MPLSGFHSECRDKILGADIAVLDAISALIIMLSSLIIPLIYSKKATNNS